LPATGYNPLTYTNNTGAARDFWIEFEQGTTSGNSGNFNPDASKSWYDCWDFTVRDATSEKPGRLYSSAWSFTGASFNNQFATTFALYPLIPNPNFNSESFFVKQVSYSRISPFGTLLTANMLGTTVGGSDYKLRRKSQPTSTATLGYAEYKMFVNDPDPAVYPSTTPPNSPTITTTCSGTASNRSTTFNLAVDQSGFGLIFLLTATTTRPTKPLTTGCWKAKPLFQTQPIRLCGTALPIMARVFRPATSTWCFRAA
jgi:hypothetical protein